MAAVTRLTTFWKAFFAVLLGGSFASAATRETEVWQSAVSQNTADGYYQYLSLFPAGDYVDEAVAALGRLGAISTPRAITPIVRVQPKVRKMGSLY